MNDHFGREYMLIAQRGLYRLVILLYSEYQTEYTLTKVEYIRGYYLPAFTTSIYS